MKTMTLTHWAYYMVAPQGKPIRDAKSFYAPNVDEAFGLARARWPFAEGWTLYAIRDTDG